METIDVQDVLDLLDWAVETYGEDHTAEARYVRDGQPICLGGVILHRTGITIEQLVEWTHWTIKALWEHKKINNFTPEAVEVLAEAQRVQDGCLYTGPDAALDHTWGSARNAAHFKAFDLRAKDIPDNVRVEDKFKDLLPV